MNYFNLGTCIFIEKERAYVYIYECVHMHVKTRGWLCMYLYYSLPYLMRQGLPLNFKLTNLAGLDKKSKNHLAPTPLACHSKPRMASITKWHPTFYKDAGNQIQIHILACQKFYWVSNIFCSCTTYCLQHSKKIFYWLLKI